MIPENSGHVSKLPETNGSRSPIKGLIRTGSGSDGPGPPRTDLVDVFHLHVDRRLLPGQQDAVPGAPVPLTLPAHEHQVVQVAAGAERRARRPDDLHQVAHVLQLRGHTGELGVLLGETRDWTDGGLTCSRKGILASPLSCSSSARRRVRMVL